MRRDLTSDERDVLVSALSEEIERWRDFDSYDDRANERAERMFDAARALLQAVEAGQVSK